MSVIQKWLDYPDLDKDLRAELEGMTPAELEEAFYGELSFGTGGIRGLIGPGTNRMNIYTLRKANYGYGNFLLKKSANHTAVIAHDSRKLSDVFTRESARVLATLGIKVYLFRKLTPTPVLSFAIRYLKTGGGIVITASHNPKAYNGYKVYDHTGCQLLPADAALVTEEIRKAPDSFTIAVRDFDELVAAGMISYLDDDVYDAYLEKVKSVQFSPDLAKDGLKVVFTPLHGTGGYLGERLLSSLGYDYVPVSEQMIPDPAFSTVPTPNPEAPATFALAIEYARKANADACIATDPDADRVGVAVRHNGDYVLLTGNQTGAVLLEYLASNRKTKKPAYLINTIVTGELTSVIARRNGVTMFSTLTGFKYIGAQVETLSSVDKEFLFAFEESYGYLLGDFTRDKDAFQGMMIILEAVNYYRLQGKTLIDALAELDRKYGYYRDELMNIELTGLSGLKQIAAVMNHFRKSDYRQFARYGIAAKEDYLLGERHGAQAGKLTLPQSDVIKYYFTDGDWLVLRPSGTEPKLKVYFSVHGPSAAAATGKIAALKQEITNIIEKTVKDHEN